MILTRENLYNSYLLDCKIKNLLIDKKYNSEIDKTLLDKEIKRLTEFKNEIDTFLPTLTEKELDVLYVISGKLTNKEVSKKYNVVKQTVSRWQNKVLNKINK